MTFYSKMVKVKGEKYSRQLMAFKGMQTFFQIQRKLWYLIQIHPLTLVKKNITELVMEQKLKLMTYVLCILPSSPNISDCLDWTILSLLLQILAFWFYVGIPEIEAKMKENKNNHKFKGTNIVIKRNFKT